jgi:predicted nucleotidyltransferase
LKELISIITDRLQNEASIPWVEVWEKSSEIVLFGSWASGSNRLSSDIDLLCVDFPRRIKTARLDLINYPSTFISSRSWLTSELANHIAHYGIWIKGDGHWRTEAHITEDTIFKKREQVWVRMARLLCTLRNAPDSQRTRELIRLRRDIQRLFLLSVRKPTPSANILDEMWKNDRQQRPDSIQFLRQVTSSTELNSITESLP